MKRLSAVLSSNASSQASSARLNQCCTMYMRSMRFSPIGGRTLPAFGQCRSITSHSACHGTIFSIVSRKASDLLGLRDRSYSAF